MLLVPLYAKAWTSQVYTEEQKSLVLFVSFATLWSSKNKRVLQMESAESSAHHRSLYCSLEETHLPGSRVWDPVPFRHIPSVPFPWALLFTEERQIELALDQKNLCLLLSVLWVSKHNSKSLSSYLNTHSNKEPSVVSSFARQGLQPRVFTVASNVPGEKVMIRNSHVLLRVGINYAGANSKGEG